ncbi:ANR54-like protein, partial [Mya arenaria]
METDSSESDSDDVSDQAQLHSQASGFQVPQFEISGWNPRANVGIHLLSLVPMGNFPAGGTESLVGKSSRSRTKRKQRMKAYKTGRTSCRNVVDERRLRLACSNNDCIAVVELLEGGADPSCADEKNRTPLHLSASQGYETIAACTCQVPIVTLLLKAVVLDNNVQPRVFRRATTRQDQQVQPPQQDDMEIQTDAGTANAYELLLCGDLNARTGVLNDFININLNIPVFAQLESIFENDVNAMRISKDNTVNAVGKFLLQFCITYSLCIVNGRVGSDKGVGDFTYYGGIGSSVVDYFICSHSLYEICNNFKVGANPESDHMPLVLCLD